MNEIEYKAIAKRDLETYQKTVHFYLTEAEKDRRTLLVEADRLRMMLRNEAEGAEHLLGILKTLAGAAEMVVGHGESGNVLDDIQLQLALKAARKRTSPSA